MKNERINQLEQAIEYNIKSLKGCSNKEDEQRLQNNLKYYSSVYKKETGRFYRVK
ncbi:MAG: hypothetical protein ACOC56_04120 [Atribacterota bacterium]